MVRITHQIRVRIRQREDSTTQSTTKLKNFDDEALKEEEAVMDELEVLLKIGGTEVRVKCEKDATGKKLFDYVRDRYGLDRVKMVCKGKKILESDAVAGIPGKVIVMGTSRANVAEVETKQSDPTLRGFAAEDDREQRRKRETSTKHQDAEYKFCRFKASTWDAEELLKSLAQDVSPLMIEFHWTVGTLEEMTDVDRYAAKKKAENKDCSLLGYNENMGKAIYLRLRDDQGNFRQKDELIQILLHELCHCDFGVHNAAFFALYANVRSAYFKIHPRSSLGKVRTLADDPRSDADVVQTELISQAGNSAMAAGERASAALVAGAIDRVVPAPPDSSSEASIPSRDVLRHAAEKRQSSQQKKDSS